MGIVLGNEIIGVLVHGRIRREVIRTAILGLQEADSGLFGRLVNQVTWEAFLKGKKLQKGWTFL